jgi:sugar phosphate isomerase/epimerase
MFICNSTWSFHRNIPANLSLLDFPAKCAEMGIEAVELLDFHFAEKTPAYMDKVKKACKKAGVKLHCLAIGNDFTMENQAEWKKQVNDVKALIKMANYLEAPVIRSFCGTRSITDAGLERVIAGYQEVMGTAQDNNVVLAMENHWGLSVNPDNVVKIIKGVYCPEYFGSCLDFGNWQKDDQLDAARKVAPFVKHAHAKSYVFDKAGNEKNIDFKSIIAILKKAGYQGALSVEFEGEMDEFEGVEKTVKLLKKILK